MATSITNLSKFNILNPENGQIEEPGLQKHQFREQLFLRASRLDARDLDVTGRRRFNFRLY